ncbi:MAG: ATP-dependent helicase RecG [Pseudomonadota bacterium]|jgi:ATP-dependent DNA helicase RecG
MADPKPSTEKPLSAPQKALRKMGLLRPVDLALHLPYRYEDETRLVSLREARDGDTIQIEGVVRRCDVAFKPRRQLQVVLDDGTDTCTLRFFNFYPNQKKMLEVGQKVRVRGEVRGGFMGRTMMHPTVSAAGAPLAQALTPVYPSTASLPQAYLRKAVQGGLERALREGEFSETLPAGLQPEGIWTLAEALRFLHHPSPQTSLATLEDRSHPAWCRLKAEELLAQQLSQRLAKMERDALRGPVLPARADGMAKGLRAALPFELTGAQGRVTQEIAADLARPVPMHRLLQGDVGSGKTVVAALAAAQAMDAGWQCALMAPTEILAEQHFRKLVAWIEPLLPAGKRVAWLTGSQKKKERDVMNEAIADGSALLVVGTHAVIQQDVRFHRLGLAIIDEQHRFGVEQRLSLRRKTQQAQRADGVQEPHMLMMSATPIPRTLAMAHYADLDVSTLDELPPGRTPVLTRLVADTRRAELVERMSAQIAQGRQVYWVCPLIEESEALDLSNATETHRLLSEALNTDPERPVLVGLLHSRMPVAEKKAVMDLFTRGEMAVLVSTTVIEVGVDVPNASLMVIEHAERFGLSQLHQLRGRVGRGAAASACVLLYAQGEGARLSDTARERLRAMVDTADGFEIARRDLEIRGPGEFLGARQSGAAMLRFADLQTDLSWLEWARRVAPVMLAQHPALAQTHLHRWLGQRHDYLKA